MCTIPPCVDATQTNIHLLFYGFIPMATFSSPIHRLVLHPVPADYAPSSWKGLQTGLEQAGFLGEKYGSYSDRLFLVGERFLQLITFMGCAPHIQLEPPKTESKDFCHIGLSPIYSHSEFRSGERDVFAHCGKCGARITQWMNAVKLWRQDNLASDLTCDRCGESQLLYHLNWRNKAGFARLYIDVYSVFPREGIPTNELLSILEKFSGVAWTFFYTNR